MARVVHFEISADDPARAVKFYETVFGWKINQWDGGQPYWLIQTGDAKEPGIDGGMNQRPGLGANAVNTVGVDSLDEAVSKVTMHGGHIIMPKMAVAGVGWLAYGTDTEGNTFGMMQSDPNAK